jgi:hypothetical protein
MWRAISQNCGKNVFDHFVLGDIDDQCHKAVK